MKEIIVDIGDDGEVRIETKGFTGKSCLKESQFLKDMLGKEISSQLTPLYYTAEHKLHQRARNAKPISLG
jgi:stress-induced morphogen